MNALPATARYYLYAVWLAAGALVVVGLTMAPPMASIWGFVPLWALFFALADYFEVEFEFGDGRPLVMTVADTVLIFLVPIGGMSGVFAIILGNALVDLLHRRPWHRTLFNIAARTITYLLMLSVYSLLASHDAVPYSGARGIAAFFLVLITYYLSNTLLVATVIALATGQPLGEVYRVSLSTVRWVHLVTAPIGAMIAALWTIDLWLAALGILPLLMARRSFQAVAAWQAESRRSRELAEEARRLARTLSHLQTSATALIGASDPAPLLEIVGAQLAALLEAPARWVILLDEPAPTVMARAHLPPGFAWDAQAYRAALTNPAICTIEGAHVRRFHPMAAPPWHTLVIIPLASDERVLGAICLGFQRAVELSDDDRRALRAFAAQAALAVEHARVFSELRVRQQELVRSSKLAALGTFAAGIGHEFNNLLAGILGYAQLGLTSDDVAEKNEALDVAVRACLRGRSITSGLLTFARRSDSQEAIFLLSDVVQETVALVERELAKENIAIVRRLAPVPPTMGDAGQLAQVLLNLLTNARDAMRDQGGGTITIELETRDGELILAVSDTGCGIPEHLIDQIFQPFVTTKGARNGSTVAGTGLGLAISYGIIEQHGGTMSVASRVGGGTTMTIRLPIRRKQAALAHAATAAEHLPRLRLLLVDDDPAVAGSLARLLEERGLEARAETSAAAALARMAQEPFDLLITDVILPGGVLPVVERFQQRYPDAPVLIITGHAEPQQLEPLVRAGVRGILYKPFTVDEALNLIARVARPPAASAVGQG